MIRQANGVFWDRQMEQIARLEAKAGTQEAIGWLDTELDSLLKFTMFTPAASRVIPQQPLQGSSVPRPPALAHSALAWLFFNWIISSCGA